MFALLLWMLFFVVLALLAPRFGVESRPTVNDRQLDWSVRTF
jgi:hypothetical protein